MNVTRSVRTSVADLWRSSALIQGLLALLFAAAIVALALCGKPIPEILGAALMAIIGFYFGAKSRTPSPD